MTINLRFPALSYTMFKLVHTDRVENPMRSSFNLLFVFIFCGFVLSTIAVTGQTVDTPIITVDNANQLTPVASVESGYLGAMAWSNDGKWLAVGTSQDSVHVLQADNLGVPPLQLAGGLDVLFHPTNAQLVSGGTVWDIESQQILFQFGAADYRHFSPDGQYLVTARRGRGFAQFTLLRMPTREVVNTFRVDTPQGFQQIVFSADSTRYALVFRSADPTEQGNSFVQVRETATATLLATLEADYSELSAVVFSNMDQYLVADNFEHGYSAMPAKVIIWDIALQSRLREFDTYDRNALLSPNRKWMFIPDHLEPLIMALDSGQTMHVLVGNLQLDVWSAVFSQDSQYLAVPYWQSESRFGIALWTLEPITDVREPVTFFPEFRLRANYTSNFGFSADSRTLAVAYDEQTILWDIETRDIQQTITDSGKISAIPDTTYLLIGTYSVWDINTATLINRTSVDNGLLSPNRQQVATLSTDTLRVVDVISGEETVLPVLHDYLGPVARLDAANDIGVFGQEQLSAYDLNTGNILLQVNPAPRRFTISPDGSLLVAWHESQTDEAELSATIHRLHDQSASIPMEGVVRHLSSTAISPDGRYLIATERDIAADRNTNVRDAQGRVFAATPTVVTPDVNNLYLYDLETGRRIKAWQQEMTPLGNTSIFSSDSQYVLTATAQQVFGSSRVNPVVIDVWEVSALLRQAEPIPLISLTINMRDMPVSIGMSFTRDASHLLVSVDDALLGDGIIHGYRVSVFDWSSLISWSGAINERDLQHVTLENAYSPLFSTSAPIVVTGGIQRIWETGVETPYLYLWDSVTGEQLLGLEGFTVGTLSADGTLLAGLSVYGQTMLWDISQLIQGNQTPLVTLDSPNVQTIAFSADGRHIYQQTSYGVVALGVAQMSSE
jgi:WD40 repeat protein